MQQFIRLEQEIRIAGAMTGIESQLLRGVSLVNQMSTGFKRGDQNREELALKKKETQNQIVFVAPKVVCSIQVLNLGDDRFIGLGEPRIFFGLLNPDIGNIQQSYLPAAFCQPDGMAANTAGKVQRFSGSCAGKKIIVSV